VKSGRSESIVVVGLKVQLTNRSTARRDTEPACGRRRTARLTEILIEAGFSSIREATGTPINVVIEARP
jgi:hypothetical protein